MDNHWSRGQRADTGQVRNAISWEGKGGVVAGEEAEEEQKRKGLAPRKGNARIEDACATGGVLWCVGARVSGFGFRRALERASLRVRA